MKKKILWKTEEQAIFQAMQVAPEISEDDENITEGVSTGMFAGFIGGELCMLQTNFRITPEILSEISMVDGVENIKPISQYQLCIVLSNSGFFNNDNIKNTIEEIILSSDLAINIQHNLMVSALFNQEIAKSFAEIRDSLYETRDSWILYVYPNGKFEIISDINGNDEFQRYLSSIGILQELVGGMVSTSLIYDISTT